MSTTFDIDVDVTTGADDGKHKRATTVFTTLSSSAMVVVYDPTQGGAGYISPLNFLNAQSALAASGAIPPASPLTSAYGMLVFPPSGADAQLATGAQIAALTGPVTPSIALTAPSAVLASTSYQAAGTLTAYTKAPVLTVLVDGTAVTPASGTPTATSFAFAMPGIAAGSHTLQVKDGNGIASPVAAFSVAASPSVTATVATPAGTPTVGQALTVTGTVSNGSVLYICLSSGGHDEATRVPATVTGSTWTASVTPSTSGSTAACAYVAATGGSPLALSRSFTVAPAPTGYADGFNAPGVYGPTTLYQNSGNGTGYVIGTYFARGLNGPVTWSATAMDGSMRPMSGNQLQCYGAAYVSPVLPTQTVTISATDGTTTYTLKVTIEENANCPEVVQGFALDTMQNTVGSFIGSVGSQSNASFTSADGAVSYGNGGNGEGIYTAQTVTGHYGLHQATFTNNGVAFPASYWFITELPPVVSVTPTSEPYTTSPVGFVLGQAAASSDAGTCTFSITSSGNVLAVSSTGQITIASALSAGTLSATLTVTSPGGKTATQTLSYVVGQGTTLPATNMTASLSTTLDNSMGTAGTPGPVTVGTVTVSGLTNPTWTIAVLDDECQSLTVYNSVALNPRYKIAANPGNPNQATITANYLSAQTDQIQVSAAAAGTVCTNVFPLTVAAKVGPSVTVSPGAAATASVFPTWNAALDAMWTTPASYQGMTVELSGGLYPQTATDFSRTTIGHGSNQQWPCGPYTLKGPSPTDRAVLDFGFLGKGTGQGALYAQGGDCTFANLVIQRVSNLSYGEGNCGAIYKTSQLPFNLTISDSLIYTSDMGPLDGDLGCHLTLNRVVLAHNGIGAGGLTHNIYAGHYSSVTATSVLSFSTAQVHEFKTRAGRGTLTDCQLLDGENGNPGASACLDIPDGGAYVINGCTFMKGPNPNNDGSMVQFCAEVVVNGPAWDVNTLLVENCTFINCCAPGSLSSPVTAVALFAGANGGPAVSPTTGIPATAIVKNCQFYNIPQANWFQSVNALNTITDGGGNAIVTEWPQDLLAIDPSTGETLASLPPPSYAVPSFQGGCLMVPTGVLQLRFPVGTAVGTDLTTVTAYDNSGAALKNPVYSIVGECASGSTTYAPSKNFAMNAATGQITVASASIPDSLRWLQVSGSGTDYTGAAQAYKKYLFVVVGNGTLPGSGTIALTSPSANGSASLTSSTAYTVAGTLANFPELPTLAVLVDGAVVTPTSGAQPMSGATSFSFLMPGLAAGNHTVAVKDTTSGAVSAACVITVAAPPALQTPGQVTGVMASMVASTTAQLAWSVPSGPAPTGYTVVCTPPGGTPLTMSAGNVTTFGLTGLTASTVYDVTVTATNAAGAGAPSAAVTLTTASASTSASVAVVQIAGVFGQNAAGGTIITLPSVPQPGNTIVLLIASQNYSAAPAINDTPPAGYTRFDNVGASSVYRMVLAAFRKTVIASDKATIDISGTGPYDTLIAIEVANLVSSEALVAPGAVLPTKGNATSDVKRYLLASNGNGSSAFTSSTPGVVQAFVPANPSSFNGIATLLQIPAPAAGTVAVTTTGGNAFDFLSLNLYGA